MNNITLRKASIKDSELIYKWAMDREVRNNSFNSNSFSYDEHLKWFKKQLSNENCDIFICVDNNQNIGQTRLYYNNDEALINYSISSEFRGKGYGTGMLEKVISTVIFERNISTFKAEVKKSNIASIKIFKKLNFNIESENDDEFVFIKKINFYIRVDANSDIATGHLMRCLSIADELRTYNVQTTFIMADNSFKSYLNSKNYRCIILNSQYSDLDSEIDILKKVIKDEKIDKLLIDSYFVTEKYLNQIKNLTKIIYIDDMDKFKYNVDVLINYNNYYKKFNYDKKYKDTKLLLGTKYFPLRQEFMKYDSKYINKTISKILIISGGTDKYNSIGKILEYFNNKNMDVTAICGRLNSNYDKLKNTFKNGNILRSVDNISDYIYNSDVVISAGGTVLYEICSIGTPTIIFSIADNQFYNVNSFHEEGLMYYIGDARFDDIAIKIGMALEYFTYEKRKNISLNMQKKVDKYGTKRIVNEIFSL